MSEGDEIGGAERAARVAVALGWLGLLGVGFGVGPAQGPGTGELVLDLLTGRFAPHPPWLVAHFQLMGLWPLLFAFALRGEWRARVPAWPFLLGSLALGCYALLPWFVLRAPAEVDRRGPLGHPAVPAALAAAALAWAAWAAVAGDGGDWWHLVRTDGFTWAMTWDFAAFWGLSVLEARRRGWWWLALVPVVGFGAVLGWEAAVRRGAGR